MASDTDDSLAHVVGMRLLIPHPGKAPHVAGGTLHAADDDLELAPRIGSPVANVAAIEPNHRVSLQLAFDTFEISRAARGVARLGPRKLALRFLLMKALADLAEPVPYRLGISAVFDRKDLSQQFGDLSEGNETCALGLEVQPLRSDQPVAEMFTELREGPLVRPETRADHQPAYAEANIPKRGAEGSSVVSLDP
jgi:hypothetical protein